MRFRKGSKVEVLSKREVPSGSWCCAEIICGNGRNYTIKYDGDDGEEIFERVPRKAIRPCPPLLNVSKKWLPGDLVEAFHNFSWKMAIVLAVLEENHFLFRLLGSSIEFEASKYDIRKRLCWKDGEWVVIGQGSKKYEDQRLTLPSSSKYNYNSQQMNIAVSRHVKDESVATRKVLNVQKSQVLTSKIMKRSPHCHSHVETYKRSVKNRRVNVYRSMKQAPLPEKLDAIGSSRDGGVRCSRVMSLDSNDGNTGSSVGSCSILRNYPYKSRYSTRTSPIENNDSQSSDAESVFRVGPEEGNFHLPKEDLREEVHRLELHAYRCILNALHASGPLSWEQELLLTNLRNSLRISNDEHLLELRNLVSNTTCSLR